MSDRQDRTIHRRLLELEIEHRDLDEIVARLAVSAQIDELLIRRLKKRKLHLKDQIMRLKSMLIPNLDA